MNRMDEQLFIAILRRPDFLALAVDAAPVVG